MQLRFFTIPVHDGELSAEELSRFLSSHRIIAVDREFVQDGRDSAWAICVSYVQAEGRPQPGKKGKVDYREVLSDTDFAVFAKLRSLRKTLADQEGVPAYALFTNEQLADMVQRRVRSVSALREIRGVGDSRIEKYAESFLDILRAGLSVPEGSKEAEPHEA